MTRQFYKLHVPGFWAAQVPDSWSRHTHSQKCIVLCRMDTGMDVLAATLLRERASAWVRGATIIQTDIAFPKKDDVGLVPSYGVWFGSGDYRNAIFPLPDEVWCGVVWCGVVWCGVVWCGVVWCGVVSRRVASRRVVSYGVVSRGVVWCGVVWCGVVWCGVAWRGVPKALLPKGKGRDVYPRVKVNGLGCVCCVRAVCKCVVA